MTEYHKIKTVWKRDPATKRRTLIEGAWATPEFEYLQYAHWNFTEKVDGTNVRIGLGEPGMTVDGKTDKAQMPPHLLAGIEALDLRAKAKAMELPWMTLCGEGYGAKIQGGGKYRPDASFVLFDVRVGDLWLERENVIDISLKLDIEVVPVVGSGSLNHMVDLVREGFTSAWDDFPAEGIVARPACELQTRRGERIITKLKCKDFEGAVTGA